MDYGFTARKNRNSGMLRHWSYRCTAPVGRGSRMITTATSQSITSTSVMIVNPRRTRHGRVAGRAPTHRRTARGDELADWGVWAEGLRAEDLADLFVRGPAVVVEVRFLAAERLRRGLGELVAMVFLFPARWRANRRPS